MGLEIAIDRKACKSAGQCVFRAPLTFELDETDRARVIDPGGDAEDVVIEAARSCPNFAIRVDKDGERVV